MLPIFEAYFYHDMTQNQQYFKLIFSSKVFVIFLCLFFIAIYAINADVTDDPSQYTSREDFIDANAREGVKYFFSPSGHVFTKDGTDITPPEMLEKANENTNNRNPFDALIGFFLGHNEPPSYPMPSSNRDTWSFLPDFNPGESVYENDPASESVNPPVQSTPSKPADQAP